jgi:hypothetical protein
MMNLNLNFLPKDSRKRITAIARMGWCVNVLRCSTIALVLFNAFLFLTYFLLMEQNGILTKRSDELTQNYSFYGNKVNDINKKVEAIGQAGRNYALLTPRFWNLIEILPPDIQLKNISLNLDQTGTMTISGLAKTREALIAYDQILKSIPWITKTILPTAQLLQKTDVNFVIELMTTPPSDK